MEIKINLNDFEKCISENLEHTGSTSWNIYVNSEGDFDCRHNTHDLSGWEEVYDFYSCGFGEEEDTSETEYAAWYVSEMMNRDEFEDAVKVAVAESINVVLEN